MAQPTHLNFDRGILRALLPSAMSFTFLRSFNEFARQFILPSTGWMFAMSRRVTGRSWAYERDLTDLNDQFARLEAIRTVALRLSERRRTPCWQISSRLHCAMSTRWRSWPPRNVDWRSCVRRMLRRNCACGKLGRSCRRCNRAWKVSGRCSTRVPKDASMQNFIRRIPDSAPDRGIEGDRFFPE